MAKQPVPTPAEVAQLCKATASKFGQYKCLECAKAIRTALTAKGVGGEIVCLKANGRTRGFIVMKSASFSLPFPAGGGSISTNGQHYGVRIAGKIYCTVFRDGIGAGSWQGQFDCDTHSFSLSVYEKF